MSRSDPERRALSGSAGGGIDPRRARIAVIALTAAALALRFTHIGRQSLWIDEILTIQAAEIGGRLTAAGLFGNVQGPLHALLVNLVGRLSTGEAALRSISALAGTATVPILYALGTEAADRRVGLIAALLGAVSPFGVWYGQEVRNYALLMMLAALSTLLIARLASGRGRGWSGYVAATTLALYSNLAGIFLAVGHAVFILGTRGLQRSTRRNWLRAAVVIALLFAPSAWGLARWTRTDAVAERVAVAPLADDEELLRGGTTFTPMAFPYAFFVMMYGYSLGPGTAELHTRPPLVAYLSHAWVVVPGAAAAVLAALLGLRALAARRGSLSLVLSGLLVPAVCVAAVAFLNVKPLNARYLSVSHPVLIVLVASGIGMLRRGPAVVLSGLLLGLSIVSLWNYATRPEYAREDVRGAARQIEALERPGDVVLAPAIADVFAHYFRGAAEVRVIYPGQASSDEEVARRVSAAAQGHGRMWFVNSRLWRTDPEGRIPAFLERSYRRLGESRLAGVCLALYDMGEEAAGTGGTRHD